MVKPPSILFNSLKQAPLKAFRKVVGYYGLLGACSVLTITSATAPPSNETALKSSALIAPSFRVITRYLLSIERSLSADSWQPLSPGGCHHHKGWW